MPRLEQRTPDVSSVKSTKLDKIISDSPVIASRATRRRSKRRIFRSSISIDPLAVTNDEDITANVQVKTPVISDNVNSIVQDDTTKDTNKLSNPSLNNAFKDCEQKVLNKSQDTCDNEENFTNAVLDSSNTSTQEFFSNASFSKIDEVCFDIFDDQKTMKTTVTQCDHEQSIEDINKGRNVEENKNIDFFTAGGASINVSKQGFFKGKRLFADIMFDETDETQTQNYESFDKKNSNEEKNRHLSSFSFANKVSTSIAKEASSKSKSVTELKNCDILHTADYKKPLVNKSPSEEVNKASVLFSTDSDNPINISKESLLNTKTLLANKSDNIDDDISIKYYEGSSVDKNSITVKNKVLSFSAINRSINISRNSPAKARTLFTEQSDTVKLTSSKIDISDNEQCDINTLIKRSKSKSFEQLNHLELASKSKKIEAKVENRQEVKIPSIGIQTAGGNVINISKKLLSRAKALFADELDYSEMDIFKYNSHNDEKIKKRNVTIPHGGLQIASGQEVSNNAALTARELFSSDRLDESNPDLVRASLQKRKLSETNVDESTPQGRNRASETKKARLSEFQARKLFFDNPSVDVDNDENREPGKKSPSIVDSILRSPKRDEIESTESDAAGSPVIGKQLISRKRRSLGHQRDKYNAPRADTKILDNENIALRENVVQGSAARGKIEDDKLNTETQDSTQAAQEKAKGNGAESSEYGDTQMMVDFINQSTRILQDRLAAALEQEAIITAKRRRARSEGLKQSVGHLYHHKQINSNARLSLRKISGGAPPVPRSHQELIDRQISSKILEITAATAATYRFRSSDFYGNDVTYDNVHGIEMEDGVRLILDENGYAGVWELLRAFLAAPGVDPNLVPARWVENHYRWIVWKLASMDRMKFGSAELPRYKI